MWIASAAQTGLTCLAAANSVPDFAALPTLR